MKREDYKVISRVLVRGPDRDSTGHAFYFCAGRGWAKNWLEVSVVDGEANPVEEFVVNEKTGEKGLKPILDMVNAKQLEELRADDQHIVVRSIEDGKGEDGKTESVDVVNLMKENARLAAEVAKLKGDNAHLKGKLDETNALLEQATKPAQELIKKVGSRR